jgi:hypothetical protein
VSQASVNSVIAADPGRRTPRLANLAAHGGTVMLVTGHDVGRPVADKGGKEVKSLNTLT